MTTAKDEEIEVVSEINTFLTPATSVKPIISDKNRVAKLTFSAPKKSSDGGSASSESGPEIKVDSDGDLIVPRKTDEPDMEELSMKIEYENSTSLDKVGLQIWRGAFLLADFIIHHREKYFEGRNVLELGSGTGMTSVVAAMFAGHVTATDINDPAILKLLEVNVKGHNKQLCKSGFSVAPLDFMESDWSQELIDTVANADVVLAADVVYHVKITTAFVTTLKRLATTGSKPKDIFIAMEKRYVFTVSDLDTVAPMYGHFLDQLESLLQVYPGCLEKPLQGGSGLIYHLTMQFVPLDFCQYFAYERNGQLVLLHLKVKPPPTSQ